MARYAGDVGYRIEEETSPGVWSAIEHVRRMKGDILRASSSFQGGDKINKDVKLNHRISLVGDSYLYERFMDLRWVEYAGTKWEVGSIELTRPRVVVTLGGVWHEQQSRTT